MDFRFQISDLLPTAKPIFARICIRGYFPR